MSETVSLKIYQAHNRVNNQWMGKNRKQCEKNTLYGGKTRESYIDVCVQKLNTRGIQVKTNTKDERKKDGKDREIMLRC